MSATPDDIKHDLRAMKHGTCTRVVQCIEALEARIAALESVSSIVLLRKVVATINEYCDENKLDGPINEKYSQDWTDGFNDAIEGSRAPLVYRVEQALPDFSAPQKENELDENRLSAMRQLVVNLRAEGQQSRADCVEELIAAVPAQGQCPEGWRLAPVEMTAKMRDAWDTAPDNEDIEISMRNAYRAAIAAAPAAPAQAAPEIAGDAELPPLPEPYPINWPQLNSQALGCGVEDRNIRDRYEAAEYGWQDGADRVAERVPADIFTAQQMREYARAAIASRAAPAVAASEQDRMGKWAKWIKQNPAQSGDHACARCVPHSDIIKPGFACAYHDALDYIAARANQETKA